MVTILHKSGSIEDADNRAYSLAIAEMDMLNKMDSVRILVNNLITEEEFIELDDFWEFDDEKMLILPMLSVRVGCWVGRYPIK